MMKRKDDIKSEKLGFKVPKGYFDDLDNVLMSRLENESFSEKSGFKIPNTYFTNFKLETPSEEKSPKVIQLVEWTKWIAAASIIALAIVSALYIDNLSIEKNLQFSDLDDDIIEKYLDYHLESPEDFIEYENTTIKNIIDKNIITLNDQDIMDYLTDRLDDQDFDNE